MARTRTHKPLNVYLNGRLTGMLRCEKSGAIDFQYDEGWLNWQSTFPISISLPLRDDRYIGAPVIAVFDNLLPDNVEIRQRIAARRDADGIDPYNLLAAIGRDCVGALQFLPDGLDPGKPGEIVAKPISDAAISVRLKNLAVAPLGMDEDEEFRISIAGAQDKTAFLKLGGDWHVPHGTTATTHILKTQMGRRGNYDLTRSVENEHMCLELLRRLGLPAAHSEIVDFDGTRSLVVERFDRHWTKDQRLLRVPQEDCCQAMSIFPTRKYQSDGGPGMVKMLEFQKASDDQTHDQLVFMKAQVAFWLLGAIDGHAKNFSVFLYRGGGFRLTPLYDVMSAQLLLDSKQLQRKNMKLAMSVGKNRHYHVHEIQPRHFQQCEEIVGMSEGAADMALNQIYEDLPDAIAAVGESLPSDFPGDLFDSISEGAMRRRKAIAV